MGEDNAESFALKVNKNIWSLFFTYLLTNTIQYFETISKFQYLKIFIVVAQNAYFISSYIFLWSIFNKPFKNFFLKLAEFLFILFHAFRKFPFNSWYLVTKIREFDIPEILLIDSTNFLN